jgi:hypothetical protein
MLADPHQRAAASARCLAFAAAHRGAAQGMAAHIAALLPRDATESA